MTKEKDMGFRTVVILSNDMAHVWEHDAALGQKIGHASHFTNRICGEPDIENYGQAVECVHADTQTIGIIDGLSFTPMAHSSWYHGQTKEEMMLKLIKEAADQMGYRLVKKSVK
jgi:hypothetical protein